MRKGKDMQKKIRICLEVQGLGEDELGSPCPAGGCLPLGDEDGEELTGAESRDFMKDIKVEEVLRLAFLDHQFTPADCRLITPEEYDREYGEDELC